MAKTLDDMKMVHEEEMQNYNRIQEAVTRVMHRHGCKIIQTPAFEEYDTYSRLFPSVKAGNGKDYRYGWAGTGYAS